MLKKTALLYAFTIVALGLCHGIAQADEPPVVREAIPHATAPDQPGFRAKQILGATVSLEAGTSVGTVDDIVLDQAGNVDYLIVVNSQRQLVTVPWDAAMFDVQKRTAVIHIAPEQFRQVPTYTAEQYPVFTTPTYRTQVYKYYGLTPGQQRRAINRAERRERREERRRD